MTCIRIVKDYYSNKGQGEGWKGETLVSYCNPEDIDLFFTAM